MRVGSFVGGVPGEYIGFVLILGKLLQLRLFKPFPPDIESSNTFSSSIEFFSLSSEMLPIPPLPVVMIVSLVVLLPRPSALPSRRVVELELSRLGVLALDRLLLLDMLPTPPRPVEKPCSA